MLMCTCYIYVRISVLLLLICHVNNKSVFALCNGLCEFSILSKIEVSSCKNMQINMLRDVQIGFYIFTWVCYRRIYSIKYIVKSQTKLFTDHVSYNNIMQQYGFVNRMFMSKMYKTIGCFDEPNIVET